jgi:hypothetical protein
MLARIATFLVAGVAVYLVLAIIFWVYCLLGGHNIMEMVYGNAATYVLSVVAAFEFAWLRPIGSDWVSWRRD